MTFKDYFSEHAGQYAQFRPDYPASLFEFLARQAPHQKLALDSASGNGQAAMSLLKYFERVIASDSSFNQIAQSPNSPHLFKMVAKAEESAIAADTVALITVAQAAHWFDHQAFWTEAKRVLSPGGLVAIWSYQLARCLPAVDTVIDYFYTQVVGPYWPPERDHVDAAYETIPFPLQPVATPEWIMQANWNLHQLQGYLETWSASQQYCKAMGHAPLPVIEKDLLEAWGTPQTVRTILWNLVLKVGRLTA